MKIAVEGCAHGELEIIYESILEYERVKGEKVDLLLCCGDFQATRNWRDLKCMAVPDKFKDIGSFYKYYSGEKVAPVLTIFIGGNHEASNYLQELPYGGWVAPNIYYLGYAGVVNVAGVRIAGLSGIYKSHDFMKGHYEFPPYSEQSIRSAYHIRNLEIFRLKQISGNVDVFLSHDWPIGITDYGNVKTLIKKKPFFKKDIDSGNLGSAPAMELLKHHYPSYWFSAHLHCKFVAIAPNEDDTKRTRFLALDKCLPKRKFLQFCDIEHDTSLPIKLSYDLEWLTVLFSTNHLLSVKSTTNYMPGPNSQGRWNFTPTKEEKEKVHHKFNYDLTIPLNFKITVVPHNPDSANPRVPQSNLVINDQTTEFCNKLSVDDPFALLKVMNGIPDEIQTGNITPFMPETPNKMNSYTDVSNEEEESLSFVIDTSPSTAVQNNRKLEIDVSPISSKSKIAVETSPTTIPTNKPRLVMTPLKLPAAKNDSTIVLDGTEESPSNNSLNSSKSPRHIDEVEKESNNVSVAEPTAEPNTKKFKRRNLAIYTDTECAT